MEALSVSEAGSEQFHDCNSQPTSPAPKAYPPAEVLVTEDLHREPSPVNGKDDPPVLSAGDSSKENSPRPDTDVVPAKEIAPASAAEKKLKRKEDKNMDYVLKALSSLSTPEEKLAALCKKYTDLLDENRQHSSLTKSSSKKLSQVSRERDSLQTENSKLILAKSKLESLCRELQRHNKVVKEESVARQREEEERRKEVSSRFQTTITDIQTQMEAHSKRNDKLQEDNKELSGKLHTLLEQYEKREEHIQKLMHQKDLESQLLEAKLAQCQLLVEKEQEKGSAEKHMLLEKLIESKTTQETMAQTEIHLKTQLQIYTDKYSEFETTLNKSNEVFAAFKSEMEKMTKKIKKLEKESLMYKQRWENTNRALLEMVEQKTLQEKLIDTQTKKNQKLESLCRALQGRAAGGTGRSPTPEIEKPKDGAVATVAVNGDTPSASDPPQNSEVAPEGNTIRPQAIGQSSDENDASSDNNSNEAHINDDEDSSETNPDNPSPTEGDAPTSATEKTCEASVHEVPSETQTRQGDSDKTTEDVTK